MLLQTGNRPPQRAPRGLIRRRQPGRLAHWKGRGPARSHAETEYRLTPIDGGTRFDYRNAFQAPLGPLGATASKVLVGGLPDREGHASLEALKKLVERG